MGCQVWFVVVDDVGLSLFADLCFLGILDEAHIFAVMQPSALIGCQGQRSRWVIPMEYIVSWFRTIRLFDA